LIALPNLVESSLADIWTLPSMHRLHAAIGKAGQPQRPLDGRGLNPIGIIMSMHLFEHAHPNLPDRTQLRLLCAYENGSVTMFGYTRKDRETSVEGIGWDTIWSIRTHLESVMAMTVSRDHTFVLTVSADHLICRYDLVHADSSESAKNSSVVHRTKHPGNAAVAIRDDGRVCAVGGWDGKIRLYSTKSMKTLGTLSYHKKSCQAVVFARYAFSTEEDGDDEDSEEEISGEERGRRKLWLAAGSQDDRVTIWQLMSFGKP